MNKTKYTIIIIFVNNANLIKINVVLKNIIYNIQITTFIFVI
jgi:hypothetical protein